MIYQEINTKIKEAKSILIISHRKPDGDTLGSAACLMNYFSSINKNFSYFCADFPSKHFLYLPLVENAKQDFDLDNCKKNFDLIITLDCGDEKQTGLEKVFTQNKNMLPFVINIDHHLTNTEFGDLNLIDPSASSTTLILYNFFKNQKIEIDKNMATCLLTGIATDTSFFSNAATTLESMQAASNLLLSGARPKSILANNYKNKSLDILKLWGKALLRLKVNDEFSIATTVITLKDLELYNLNPEAIEGIANFLNNLGGVKAVAIIKEELDNKIKVSMRTTYPNVDVSKIATAFGGGGHKKAAGFTISGKIKEEDDNWIIE